MAHAKDLVRQISVSEAMRQNGRAWNYVFLFSKHRESLCLVPDIIKYFPSGKLETKSEFIPDKTGYK